MNCKITLFNQYLEHIILNTQSNYISFKMTDFEDIADFNQTKQIFTISKSSTEKNNTVTQVTQQKRMLLLE